MFKLSLKNIFVSGDFWRILCQALFALGELIACIINDGSDGLDDESVAD